jgi:hypothetical protein
MRRFLPTFSFPSPTLSLSWVDTTLIQWTVYDAYGVVGRNSISLSLMCLSPIENLEFMNSHLKICQVKQILPAPMERL